MADLYYKDPNERLPVLLRWTSANGRPTLSFHSVCQSARFDKVTRRSCFQGTNNLIVHDDHQSGTRHLVAAKNLVVSEDDRCVYSRPTGHVVEETEAIPADERAASHSVSRSLHLQLQDRPARRQRPCGSQTSVGDEP